MKGSEIFSDACRTNLKASQKKIFRVKACGPK